MSLSGRRLCISISPLIIFKCILRLKPAETVITGFATTTDIFEAQGVLKEGRVASNGFIEYISLHIPVASEKAAIDIHACMQKATSIV